MTEVLQRVRIVLVETSHPGNIGAAARAMKTMGLSRLVLVRPRSFPHPEAVALAAGADDVLAQARVVEDMDQALADCRYALGCSARLRGVAMPTLGPREGAAALLNQSAAGAEVALLFGSERTGLTNDELQRCQGAVHIASDPEFSSLNLAAAVQVLAYELRMAALQGTAAEVSAPATDEEKDAPATSQQLEGFFGHLQQALADIDFFKRRSPDVIMRRLRRLYFRSALSEREVKILRGILSDAQRMARLAAAGNAQGEQKV